LDNCFFILGLLEPHLLFQINLSTSKTTITIT
jgi:hypothetical protein